MAKNLIIFHSAEAVLLLKAGSVVQVVQVT